KKITASPQRFIVLGCPLVVYRLKNQIIVLQDRCPHRGVPLSEGRVKGELLQCRYHGWSFDAAGRCVSIPGLVKTTKLDDKCVKAYSTTIKYGLVFVCMEEQETTLPVYEIPALRNKDFHFHCMEFSVHGDILNLIENVLD